MGHTFSGDVPTTECENGHSFLSGPGLERFYLLAARNLADAGIYNGEMLRFMRRSLGLRAVDVAEWLDVRPETISDWEKDKGKKGPPRAVFLALADLVRARLSDDHLHRLHLFREVRQPKLELETSEIAGSEWMSVVAIEGPCEEVVAGLENLVEPCEEEGHVPDPIPLTTDIERWVR